MKVLLTGFEPFGSSSVNPSEQAARMLCQMSLPGIELSTAILPVDRLCGPSALLRAVQATQPEAVVCLGEASRRAALSIERVALNLLDFRMPDNAGHQCIDEPVAPDGPAAYFVTLPVRAMLDAVRAAGIPAELSLSAGTFLCNQVLYELLHHLARRQLAVPAGFIHVPALPEQAAKLDAVIPSMDLDTIVRGVAAALGALQTWHTQHAQAA